MCKIYFRTLTFVIAFIISLPLFITGCGEKCSDIGLYQAELLMTDAPDSALHILDGISVIDLKNDADKALYGLLYTQARDKNYLNPDNEALISFSVNFYAICNDPKKLAMASYYQGRVHLFNNNPTAAIVSFLKAKEVAESNGLYFWSGMACRGISDIYNAAYNMTDELIYAQQEYDQIKKSGCQPYLNYALYDLGRAKLNNDKYEDSYLISRQLLDSAEKYDDAYLKYTALQLESTTFIAEDRFIDAYPSLKEICSGEYAETKDSLNLCLSLLARGEMDESENWLKSISENDLVMSRMLQYMIEKEKGNFKEALEKLEFVNEVTNSDYRLSSSHNLSSSLIDYFEVKSKLDKEILKVSRIRNWLVISVASIVCLILGGIGYVVFAAQKRKLMEKILLAESLQLNLDKNKESNAKSLEIIKSLISAKYELFEELCLIVYTNNDTKNARKKIADKVTQLIEDLSIGHDNINHLVDQADIVSKNLYADFKKDLPKLKESDYRLFLFSILGLSTPVITVLLKEDKIEAVYNRKKRLKNKIKSLDQKIQDKYLPYL